MLTGNIQSILASDESTETLTDLMIGCDEYKPYNYFDENGNLVGIDADYLFNCNYTGDYIWDETTNYVKVMPQSWH